MSIKANELLIREDIIIPGRLISQKRKTDLNPIPFAKINIFLSFSQCNILLGVGYKMIRG